MEKLKNNFRHWTDSTINFTHRIASDFLAQVETKIEKGEVNHSELARRLDRTPGRVSQLFNAGNITLSSAVRLARAASMKVALVAYDDGDPQNNNGPVNPEIFTQCWKYMGGPTTFFELTDIVAPIDNLGGLLAFANNGEAIDLTPLNVKRNAVTRPLAN
jgi:hypothetical protein